MEGSSWGKGSAWARIGTLQGAHRHHRKNINDHTVRRKTLSQKQLYGAPPPTLNTFRYMKPKYVGRKSPAEKQWVLLTLWLSGTNASRPCGGPKSSGDGGVSGD
jgi:hypothetical protein